MGPNEPHSCCPGRSTNASPCPPRSARRDRTATPSALTFPGFRAQKNHAGRPLPAAIRTSCPTTSGTTSGRASRIDEDEDDEMGGGSRDSYTVYVPSPRDAVGAARAAAGGGVQAVRARAQCRAADCGTCKNCRDKPRFGGPGVKKKACVARACVRAQQQADEESDDQSEEDAASAHGSEPSTVHEISPAILATDGGGVVTSPQHQRPRRRRRGAARLRAARPAPRPRAPRRRPSSAGELSLTRCWRPFKTASPSPSLLWHRMTAAFRDCTLCAPFV